MSEVSTKEDAWNCVDLTYQDICRLRDDDLLPKIRNENRIDLLPFFGYLHFKDAIWVGNVQRLTPNKERFEMTDRESERCEFFVLEIKHKIIDELKTQDPVPKLPTGITVFTTGILPNTTGSNAAIRSFGEYFISTYGRGCHQSCQDIPFIYSLDAKLEEIVFRETLPRFSSIWSLKADAFVAVLSNPECSGFNTMHDTSYEIREMSFQETHYAVGHWKFASEAAIRRFSASSSLGLAVGAFPSGGNWPVSWAFCSWDGAIAALRTQPEHQRKGLAKAVVKAIAGKIIERGLIPFVYIESVESSYIPESFFKSIGFEVNKKLRFHWSLSC